MIKYRFILFLMTGTLFCWAQQGMQNDTLPVLEAPRAEQSDLLDELESDGPLSGGPSLFKQFLNVMGLRSSSAKQGSSAYKKEDYDLALQKFMEAQIDNPESQALTMNIGNAQYKKKKYDEAIEAYKKALVGEDTKISASAYYNLGNAHFRKGEFKIQQGDQQGIQDYRAAMANYKKSLEMYPDNQDAKQNIEVVQVRIKELLQKQEQQQQQQCQNENKEPPPKPSEKAKEVLARAMQLVKQRKYTEAKQLLEAIIQEDETAISFQSHVQRIDDVMNILDGKPLQAPMPQDPRTQQQGLGVI
ncbi:MAG: tetratricopeptide repeat protein [Fibrobacteria bacterium]|nr:tetratricopeptide repeat protein [Fibrobacteria bacterium]